MLFFRKRKQPMMHCEWDLSAELLRLSAGAAISVGDACSGVGILGSTGSGKSTGSLAALVRAYLRAGFGGLFLTAKREDRKFYEKLIREEGREDSLMVFSPDNLLRYNFIDAEMQQSDGAVGLAENLTALLMTVADLLDRGSGASGGRENETYFRQMASRLARNSIQALVFAHGRVTVPMLHELITSCACTRDEVLSPTWQNNSFCYRT
ncbi:MAG TPA: hypothetical protein VG963_19035, partial [Polyangiaceae bacterium]|nr:hypothetical protein [Polyangiaceae bacterium]